MGKSCCCCDNSFPDEAALVSQVGTKMLTSRTVGISAPALWWIKLVNVKEIVHMQIGRR